MLNQTTKAVVHHIKTVVHQLPKGDECIGSIVPTAKARNTGRSAQGYKDAELELIPRHYTKSWNFLHGTAVGAGIH